MKNAAELGAALKEARAARKLTLVELSEKTGLPEKYLKALEDGRHDVLPGKAYARIYYLNYARALGLDTDTLMLDWPQSEHQPPTSPLTPEPSVWPKRIFVLAVIVVVVGVSYALWRGRQITPTPRSAVSAPDTSTTLAVPDSAAVPSDSGMLDTTAVAAQTAESMSDTLADTLAKQPPDTSSAEEAAPAPTYSLEVRANSQSWVVIEADGDTVQAALLAAGHSLRAVAKNDFVITAARPEAVRVLLDGKRVSLPADRMRALVRYKIDPKAEEGKP